MKSKCQRGGKEANGKAAKARKSKKMPLRGKKAKGVKESFRWVKVILSNQSVGEGEVETLHLKHKGKSNEGVSREVSMMNEGEGFPSKEIKRKLKCKLNRNESGRG